MKHTLRIIILFVFLFLSSDIKSQNYHNIESDFSLDDLTLSVKQKSTYVNQTSNKLSNIIMYDWNNSYSSIDSPLSKKLYSEYDSSILKSNSKKRGKTVISKILVNDKIVKWERIPNHNDLIEIHLNEEIDLNEQIIISFEYDLYIPNFVLNYGHKNSYINLKNCFLRFSPYINNQWLILSNQGLDDQFMVKSNVKLKINYDSKTHSVSNLDKKTSYFSGNIFSEIYEGTLISDIFLILTDDLEFENLTLNKINISTNSKNILSLKQYNISNIDKFLIKHFPGEETRRFVLDDNEFKKNSLYPYSEIPDFLDPFQENTLNEINLVKNILKLILSNSLNINRRDLYWLSSGLELFYLNKFIDEYHSDLSMIGKFSNLFFIKNHNLSLMKFNDQFKLGYKFIASRNLNQKLSIPSNELTRVNYILSNPSKSLFSLKFLSTYIGKDNFNNSITKLFNSDYPLGDLKQIKNIFELNSSTDLKWFFENYLEYDGLIDLKISEKKGEYKLKNIVGKKLSFPVPIKVEYLDKSIKNHWINDLQNLNFERISDINKIIIDPNNFLLENNYKNNVFITQKKNTKKTIFRFFSDFDDKNYSQIFYRPQFLYNLYDGFSPGITLTNKTPIKKSFTYLFSPFYSFESEKIIGNASFNFTNYHSKTFSTKYFLSLSKFHYDNNLSYLRFSPSIIFTFRDLNLVSNFKQFLRFKYIGINREKNNDLDDYGISKFTYINSNPGAKKSYSFSYDLQFNQEIIKNSITFNYRNYFSEFRQYNFRLFVGKFFKNTNSDGIYNFNVSRASDYLYDNYLLGRSESSGFFSQQYVRFEGAFKSQINEYNPNSFMLSLNSGITLWKWIEAYFDYGLFKNKNNPITSGFDTGFRLNIVENYFELFFPIYSSEDFYLNENSYSSRIRFILTLDPENLSTLFTRRWF
ncbi:MAG: hypothetical protein CMD13_01525 [Flavobacteriales bacterium]|nr:hypothetical protein [Flavobacteriales bacterium]